MKLFVVLCLVLATVYAKDELSGHNCEGSNAIVKLTGLADSKEGAVCRHSTLSIDLETEVDTADKDPFTTIIDVVVKKYLTFGYVTIPDAMLDKIGKDIEKRYAPTVKYIGLGKFEVHCLFKSFGGHCLPQKGKTNVKVPMEKFALALQEVAGPLANGYFRLYINGNTDFGEQAFCFHIQLKVDVDK